MEHFSWSDTFHALLSPCLSCLRAAHPHPHLQSNDHLFYDRNPNRSDQASLEGLLASDASSEEAETLSLHSNFGAGRLRKKKKRAGNWIRLWGWDLFGKRAGAIQLPPDADEDEDGDGDEEAQGRRRERRERRRKATLSSSTLDSDAAPVDLGAITEQLAAQPEPALSPRSERDVEDGARERAERKARRKERKELKRAALAYSLEHGSPTDPEEFEGFQGSGSAPRIPSPFTRAHRHQDSASSHTSSSGNLRSPPVPHDAADEEEELADADFDARAYAKRRSSNGGSGGTGSGSRSSDSRSRTSALQSGIAYNNHSPFPPSPLGQPDHEHDTSATSTPKPKHTKTKSKSSKSSSSKKSSTNSNTSDPTDQSPSLASPTTSQFLDANMGGGEQLIDVRREDFLNLNLPSPGFNLNLGLPSIDGQVSNGKELGSGGLGNGSGGGLGLSPNGGFPSAGLGGSRSGGAVGGGMNGVGKRDVGAFLSKSGWDA